MYEQFKNNTAVADLLDHISIPRMAWVRQSFPSSNTDTSALLLSALTQEKIRRRIKAGMNIAITAGSRGICDIPLILKKTVEFVQSGGGNPFLIPAMGSHGGATVPGQKQLLSGYGITEESMGLPRFIMVFLVK